MRCSIIDHFHNQTTHITGADPGFPVGGNANPLEGGAPTYDFAKISEKLQEIEKILGHRGRPPWIRHYISLLVRSI